MRRMLNADLARLINSDEVQSIVNPAKEGGMLGELPLGAKKANPLKNRAAMLTLNPYFATIQKNEMSGATKRSASEKAEAVKAYKKVFQEMEALDLACKKKEQALATKENADLQEAIAAYKKVLA